MIETIIVASAFAILLGLEWHYQSRMVRVGTVTLALVGWMYAQPSYTVAGRRASSAPSEMRVTQLRGEPLSEYLSGVATMRRAVIEQVEARSEIRLMALGVLVWLACSPVLRRERHGSSIGASQHANAEGVLGPGVARST